ncbi:MAG: RDD family protein [Pseudomonadota bacterium]
MTSMTVDPMPGLPDPLARPEFYAGVPLKRALAWGVDSGIILLLTGLVSLVTVVGLFFLPAMFLLIGFLYRWVTIANGSATPGMRLLSIELRDRDGSHLDAGQAFLHTAGYSVSVAVFPLQLISIALMLISDRGQGLTDHILGTTALTRAV